MSNVDDIINMRLLLNAIKKSNITVISGRNGVGKSIHIIRLCNILPNSILYSNEMTEQGISEYASRYNIEINFHIKTSTGSENLIDVIKDNSTYRFVCVDSNSGLEPIRTNRSLLYRTITETNTRLVILCHRSTSGGGANPLVDFSGNSS